MNITESDIIIESDLINFVNKKHKLRMSRGAASLIM